jgi:hypothetical protein
MDYFSIIKRLGLFQSPPVKSHSACRLPPVSAKSLKIPPTTHLAVSKPSVYSPSTPLPPSKEPHLKLSKMQVPRPKPLKFKYLSSENSPRYSAVQSSRKKQNFPSSLKNSTPNKLQDEFSGISAWSDYSINNHV